MDVSSQQALNSIGVDTQIPDYSRNYQCGRSSTMAPAAMRFLTKALEETASLATLATPFKPIASLNHFILANRESEPSD